MAARATISGLDIGPDREFDLNQGGAPRDVFSGLDLEAARRHGITEEVTP
jgi:hypothetical protein